MAEEKEYIFDYDTVLSNFTGPLDLLLHLINQAKIEIKDIFVSQVTEQFLAYMQGLPSLDVDKISEYLNVAATILKIKAQALVPNLEEDSELEEEIEEDKQSLIRSLEEYKRIKEEAAVLKERETVGFYYKEPDRDVGETKTVFNLDTLTMDGLIAAFSRLLLRQESKRGEDVFREIPRDEFTVEQKATFILERLEEEEQVVFDDLFSEDRYLPEVVTTFQAMLELLKQQYLRVRQDEIFGEIFITRNPDRQEEPIGKFDEYD